MQIWLWICIDHFTKSSHVAAFLDGLLGLRVNHSNLQAKRRIL